MRLSENFPLEELTATDTGLPNQPDEEAEVKLLYLANYVLQPIRDRWGRIDVTSGYRSGAVNKAVGGSETSQHRLGEAADIVPAEADLKAVYRWIVEESRIAFGQAIYERDSWLHVALCRLDKPNREALVFNGKRYERYMGAL
jgi:uncharacterized protein YcbK (DUF882 family)